MNKIRFVERLMPNTLTAKYFSLPEAEFQGKFSNGVPAVEEYPQKLTQETVLDNEIGKSPLIMSIIDIK